MTAEGTFPKVSRDKLYAIEVNKFHYNQLATYVVGSPYGDYTDIQTALNNLNTLGGKIFVKAGSYTITSPIQISGTNIIIEGEGVASQIRYNGNNFEASGAIMMADTTQRAGIQIRNLRISNIGATGSGTAIDMSHFAVCRFSDLWIDGSPKYGIIGSATGTLYNYIENCRIGFGGISGVGIGLYNTTNETTIMRTRMVPGTGSKMSGFDIDSHGCTLYDCDVEASEEVTAFNVMGTGNDSTFIGPYTEGNGNGFIFAANVEAPTIIGGTIIDSTNKNLINNGAKGLNIYNTRLQYEQFTYTESLNGFPGVRWISPYHNSLVSTSATPNVGSVYLEEFETKESCFAGSISWVKGGTQAGSVLLGIYGPITTEETCAGAPLLIQTGSVIVSAGTNTEESVALTAKTLLKPGRYYAAITFSDATNTFQRNVNQTQAIGWTQVFSNTGNAFTDLPTTCPAVTNTPSNMPGMRIRCGGLTSI